MIWAILSDVHGNLEALQAVLANGEKEGAQQIAFLGDAVGYGANPNECLTQLAERSAVQVAGNHDYGAVGLTDVAYFNLPGRAAIEWTASVLTEENHSFLRRLPLVRQTGEICLAHAALHHPDAWDYIFTAGDAEESFRELQGLVAFIGHSHQPLILARGKDRRVKPCEHTEMILEEGTQYIINSGSVGQPRDHNPMAAYGIYNDRSRQYRLKRVPYDIRTAQEKIIRAGLHPFLAERLSSGR